jgi:hypothetical protein
MSKKEQKAALKRKLAQLRGANGAYRQAYFEEGGDLAGWRGRSSVYVDRKKKADKYRCRKGVEE